ncbi:hypothetical protein N9X61_01265 [Sulfurimonas sp.]|nr:hypothetical protein [Sulfurimonas sp.]
MQFNDYDNLLDFVEERQGAEMRFDMSGLSTDLELCILDEVNTYLETEAFEPQHHHNGHVRKKGKAHYDDELHKALDTAVKELRYRGLDDKAETIQQILVDISLVVEPIPYKMTIDKQNIRTRENYEELFITRFNLNKIKAKALAKALSTILS